MDKSLERYLKLRILSGTVTAEHLTASIRSAVEDKVRRGLREQVDMLSHMIPYLLTPSKLGWGEKCRDASSKAHRGRAFSGPVKVKGVGGEDEERGGGAGQGHCHPSSEEGSPDICQKISNFSLRPSLRHYKNVQPKKNQLILTKL